MWLLVNYKKEIGMLGFIKKEDKNVSKLNMIQTMSKFNTYMAGIDADFYNKLCLEKGELSQYKI